MEFSHYSATRICSLIVLLLNFPALLLAQTAKPVLNNPKTPTRHVAFSPDGRKLAAAFGEINQAGSLVVWEWQTARQESIHTEDVGVVTACFSPDGKFIAIGMFGPAAKLLSADSGDVIREFRGHTDHVRTVCFVSDDVIATGSYDRSVRLWDVSTGKQIAELGQHDQQVRGIAASSDGKWLLTGATSPDARLWSISDQKQVTELRPNDSICPTVGFSRDSRFLLTGRWDSIIRIQEISTLTLRAAVRINNRSFAISPDNTKLLVCGDQPVIKLVHLRLNDPPEDVRNRVQTLIAMWNEDDYRRRQDATQQMIEIGMVAEPLLREAMNSESVEVRIRARRARTVLLSPEAEPIDICHEANVGAVCFAPDGRFVATGDDDGMVKVWDINNHKVLATFSSSEKSER